MKKMVITAILLTMAALSNSFAQKVPDAQKNLQQFTGKWFGKNVSFEMGGTKFTVDYTADFKSAAAGSGLVMHEWFNAEGIVNYVGENIVGYDPHTQLIHWYSIDNTGTCHDHSGYWITPKHLFVQHQGVVEGKMYVEQIDFEFTSPTEMRIKLIGMHNGKTEERLEGTFKKIQ